MCARRQVVRILVLVAGLAAASDSAASSHVDVGIWNGSPQPNGSLINATTLANVLVGANVNINAHNSVNILEDVDLSMGGPGGAFVTAGFLRFIAPTSRILGSVTLGNGNFQLQTPTVELAAAVLDMSGDPVSASRFFGMPASIVTSVSVTSNAAFLQQAVGIAGAGAVIDAVAGSSSSLDVNKAVTMNLSGGEVSGSVALSHADAAIFLFGSAFALDTGGGFLPIGAGPVPATAGSLQGVFASGEPFSFSFTQLAGGQLTIVPEPGTLALVATGLALLARRRERRN